MLAATTRICGLIGADVSHSFSPAMHNAAFAHLELDMAYAAWRVSDVPKAIEGARALGFLGLNVTSPHKEVALAACIPDDLAIAVGAVNTIVFSYGAARGTNTDVHGVERALDAFAPRHLEHAVVVGAGGAARAVIYALASRGIKVKLIARRECTLHVGSRSYRSQPIEDAGFADADLVIDATPLGLGEGPPAWSVNALPPRAVVLDLCVRRSTPLTRAAAARGLVAQAGDTMLLHQGVIAFERFAGRHAPVEVMRAALDRALDAKAAC
ncbi:MAG: shikimate dehydrogenase [Polyangia bacterium]